MNYPWGQTGLSGGLLGSSTTIIKLAQSFDGTLYGLGDQDNTLYTINKTTGAATSLGAITGGTPSFPTGTTSGDITFDPNNSNRLFISTQDSNSLVLYAVDVTTRQATYVGDTGLSTTNIGSLGFGPDGLLYTVSNGNLYRLGGATAATPNATPTLVGATGVNFGDFASIATATPSIDLQITQTDNLTNVAPGSPITYTIEVTNLDGTNSINGISVSEIVPSDITGVTWTATIAGEGSFPTPVDQSGSGNNITALVNLSAGAKVTYSVTGTVSALVTSGTTLTSNATVTLPSGVNDPNTANNSATDTTTVDAPPTLSSSNPADNAINVAVANNLVLTFSEAIARGTGNIVLYNSADTVVETFNAATSNRLTFSGSTLTIDPTSNLASSTGYYLQIVNGAVKDSVGNNYAGINNNTTLNFTTADVIAPTLASSTPTDNAINVAVASNLVLTFSEAIARGTGNIVLYNSAGTPVETFDVATSNRLTFSGSTLTIDPSAGLGSSTGYYLQIASTAITDTSGNAYVGIGDNTTLNFTTADIAAPTLTSSNPADDAVNVAVASNLVLTFSEAIAKGTGSIVLYRADGTAVETFNAATSNRLSFSGSTLTIDPSVNLGSSTDYYLRIDDGAVKDVAGNNYAGIGDNTTLNFTTADVIAPTLASSTPADNAINVAVADSLVLTFSEAIAKGTGNITLYKADNTAVETFAVTSNRITVSGQTLTIDRMALR